MPVVRAIANVMRSVPTIEGAGVHLNRVFGFHQVPVLDPFLLLDEFHSENPDDYLAGFPWHPHRGIETITYILRGSVEHGDSMGNAGVISSGDVQWMTAGSGIIHQEMPGEPEDGVLWGFQLWANLPASDKMMPPRYRDVTRDTIPTVELANGISIMIICGTVNGVTGPVQDIVIEPEYLDVTVPAGASFTRVVPSGHTAIAYVFEGSGHFGPSPDPSATELSGGKVLGFGRDGVVGAQSLVLFADGDAVQARAGEDATRFLFISGRPIGEPIAWGGPIVMNTNAELRLALQEYRDGTFLGHGA